MKRSDVRNQTTCNQVARISDIVALLTREVTIAAIQESEYYSASIIKIDGNFEEEVYFRN